MTASSDPQHDGSTGLTAFRGDRRCGSRAGWENQAFASVVLAWEKEADADMSKVNVNGDAIALGHPLGATGTKLLASLVNELERTGGRYGLQATSEGGGMANATIIERLG
jgi:acetyl-CoA acyltransferase